MNFKTIENEKNIISNVNNNNNNNNKISVAAAAAKNIINNNIFINVASVNNMELKIDENFVKKIGNNCKIVIKDGGSGGGEENTTAAAQKIKTTNNPIIKSSKVSGSCKANQTNQIQTQTQICKKTKIKKILEFGNFSFSNSKKLTFYVYNIANTYLGIYFSDSCNLIKNFNKNENARSNFYYLDNMTGNSIKFDNLLAESYLSKKTGVSEDLYKKLEAMRLFSKKYEKYFSDKICENKNYNQSEADAEIENLYIKKIIKNKNAILLNA